MTDAYGFIKKNAYLLFFLFLAAGFIAYFPALKGGFAFDDLSLVVNNSYIKNIRFLPDLLTKDIYHFSSYSQTSYFRPLLSISFALDYAVWRLNPLGFHITNILLHSINCFLIFSLLLKLFSRWKLAFITALLFSVHPIHTSAVSYISGRADLLALLFILLSSIFLCKYLDSGKKYSYIASLLFFLTALASRENALLMAPIAILITLIKRPSNKDDYATILGYLAISVFYIWLRANITTQDMAVIWPSQRFFPFPVEILNFINILKKYALILLLPWPLVMMRATNPIFALSFSNVFFFILISLLLAAAVKDFKKSRGPLSFGFFWALITLLPLIKMMYTLPSLGIAMAEHWLYLPSVGIFILISCALCSFRKFPKVLFSFLILFYLGLSIINNCNWSNAEKLYRNTLMFTPRNNFIRHNLAMLYAKNRDFDKALDLFNQIILTEPDSWRSYNEIGNIYFYKKDYKNALLNYKKCLLYKPGNAQALYNLGLVYEEQAEHKQAYDSFVASIENDPEYWLAYMGLGEWYSKRGYYPQSIESFKQALLLNPDNWQVYYRLGCAYGNNEQFDEAIDAWKKGLALNPSNLEMKNYIKNAQRLKTQ